MSRFTIIVAATKSHGIGLNGRLPWRLPKELKYFSDATTAAPEGQQNLVIMGRKCWESIPKKHRPLPKRLNVVVSRNQSYDLGASPDTAVLKDSLKSASALMDPSHLHRGFIIGGSTLYEESLGLPLSPTEPCVDRVLLTRILSPAFDDCDVFMTDFVKDDPRWTRAAHAELKEWVGFEVPEGVQEENGVTYEFQMWVRK
ncbi:Dihydrofolate reductase [Psilocybe cubensis]|uniref:Dihydrofolate reductase n=2 Tax=Psilocybe cubensis TaxID=181762 RepID=A0A8H7YB33_PSICU|nr:Dihydrofolate reductase [Psilocybe cubensis]KAH9486953.1 Dihydrofolate reductase [Psilocybe cubensis]